MISYSGKQKAALGLLILLCVFTNPFPAGAQSIINLRLNTSSGNVTWNPIRNVTRHVLYFYMGCRGPVREVEIQGSASSYQVPDYQPGLAVFVKLTFYYISPISHEEVIRNQTSDLQSDGDVSCWIPPAASNLPPVEAGIPSGVQTLNVVSSSSSAVVYIIPDVFLYEFAYRKCGGSWITRGKPGTIPGTPSNSFLRHNIPDFDPNVGYDYIARALREQNGNFSGAPYSVVAAGFANNGVDCPSSTTPVTIPPDPPPVNPPPQQPGPPDTVSPGRPGPPAESGSPGQRRADNKIFASFFAAPVTGSGQGGLTVSLSNTDGRISWNSLPGAAWYRASWAACGSRLTQIPTFEFTNSLIASFNASVRYDIRIDAFDAGNNQLGFGVVSNNLHCATAYLPVQTNVVPSDAAQGPAAPRAIVLQVRDTSVSLHNGSSLVVYIDGGGNINARDAARGTTLSAPGSCNTGQILASSNSFVISCTAEGYFRVSQVQPQHPADGRRDLLFFNANLSSCYRAYEYVATGRIEVFWRKC